MTETNVSRSATKSVSYENVTQLQNPPRKLMLSNRYSSPICCVFMLKTVPTSFILFLMDEYGCYHHFSQVQSLSFISFYPVVSATLAFLIPSELKTSFGWQVRHFKYLQSRSQLPSIQHCFDNHGLDDWDSWQTAFVWFNQQVVP